MSGEKALDIRRVPISKIDAWDKNPRLILPADFERLKAQITRLGIYKPLLCYREKTRYVVLGGNMRVKALKDLGFKEIEVSVVTPKTEAEKLEYSLSDNDRAGQYDEDKLGALVSSLSTEIDLSMFKADLGEAIDMKEMLERFEIEIEPPRHVEFDESIETKTECPSCGYRW